MTVAIIGANGQLGTDVISAFQKNGDDTIGLTHDDLDIASLDATRAMLNSVQLTVIVNTAAMHHVEHCEKDPDRAYAVNAEGPRNLSIVANELNAKLVHISTDYVFDGSKEAPYIESDSAAPLNVYGNTKLAGEQFVQQTARKYFIVRTSALYGKSPCRAKGGLNFVELMLKLSRERKEVKVVDDEIVTPTHTAELGRQIVRMSCSHDYGIYHATAEGSCSWMQFAKEIFRLVRSTVSVVPAGPGDFPAKVRRPKYSVLENQRLKANQLNLFFPWQHGIREYLSITERLPAAVE